MAGSLESVLASIPGYGGYLAKRQADQQQENSQLAQAQSLQGLLAHMQQQQDATALRNTLAASGGDVEKALAGALQSGNVKAAHDLAPLAKIQQERRSAQETTEGLAALNAPQTAGQPEQVGGPPDPNAQPAAPANPQDARTQRVAYLTKLGSMPKYANNPIVQQRLQAEIDKLNSVKPMIEHNFSVGNDQVQPHISYDEGRTWQPIQGSKPSAKFAKTVEGVDSAGQPTADTLEMDAWRYLTDGTLPTNMGRGVQGAKQATDIRNRAAAVAKDMGMSPDEIRMSQLTNKTQVQAIGQLAKAKAQILQFEKTAEMNADLAEKASAEVDRTQIPLVNRALQSGRSELLGDPKTKVFHAAMETFITEYARVMSGGYGAAQTNEGAQQRAHQLLNTSATPEQVRGVIKQLRAEMGNRVNALNKQMEEEKQNLRSGVVRKPAATPAATPPTAPAPAGAHKAGDKDVSKSGKPITFDGTQWNYD